MLFRSTVEFGQQCDAFVKVAADGAAGLCAVRAGPPDLVLLDYNMPVMDGLGFLRELRADPAISKVVVVMLTANESPSVLSAAARLRVRDYLLKPCEGAVLTAKLGVAVEEIDESQGWLLHLERCGLVPLEATAEFQHLLAEAGQLAAILTADVVTARRRGSEQATLNRRPRR